MMKANLRLFGMVLTIFLSGCLNSADPPKEKLHFPEGVYASMLYAVEAT